MADCCGWHIICFFVCLSCHILGQKTFLYVSWQCDIFTHFDPHLRTFNSHILFVYVYCQKLLIYFITQALLNTPANTAIDPNGIFFNKLLALLLAYSKGCGFNGIAGSSILEKNCYFIRILFQNEKLRFFGKT